MQDDLWFHSFDFPDGEKINGICQTASQDVILERLSTLDVSFLDRDVLDIGCFDGYFSLNALRNGAKFVTGIDIGPWGTQKWKEHYQYVMSKYGITNFDCFTLDFYNWDETDKKDLVLFQGVLYHLENPLLGLHKLRRIVKNQVVVETHIDCEYNSYPSMRYYPNMELNNDPTNWWGPNILCVLEMMKTAGFVNVRYAKTCETRCLFVGEVNNDAEEKS